MDVKRVLLRRVEDKIKLNSNLKILDLGSGRSKNFLFLMRKYPSIRYVGLEPNKSEAQAAKEELREFKNAKVVNDLAYDIKEEEGSFDLCISLSALEHIKNLELFLRNSVKYVKPGADIIHFYDLGHALYPHSLKERLHVFLGNHFPLLLPETKFMRYLSEEEVKRGLIEAGAEIEKVSYHQMRDHRQFMKLAQNMEGAEDLIEEIFEWEFKASEYAAKLESRKREKLFPSICVWARRIKKK